MAKEDETEQKQTKEKPSCLSVSCLLSTPFDAATLTEAALSCRKSLGADPDLVLAFVSSDYRPHLADLIEILRIDGHATSILGTSAGGLLGFRQEHENTSGISLLFLKLPRVTVVTSSGFHPPPFRTASGAPSGILFFGNPVTEDWREEWSKWNERFPETNLIGGLATGGPEPEDLFLFTEEGKARSATVSACLSGPVRLEPLVAQSCRPIGEPFVVTGAESEDVFTIGRKRAFSVLEDTFDALPDELQAEADGSIFAGLAVNEEVEKFDTGNFLIRHIVSADLKRGWLQLTSAPRVGQTMQFQMRDAAASEAVLRERCDRLKRTHGAPFAGMVCSGQGRGRSLYGAEDRDMRILKEHLGAFPIAGFFSFAEFGPVGQRNFRHDHSLCGMFFYEEESDS